MDFYRQRARRGREAIRDYAARLIPRRPASGKKMERHQNNMALGTKIEHVIFCFKGIHTGSLNWNDFFREWCKERYPSVAVEEFDCGKIFGLQMYACGLLPILGWRRQDNAYNFIRKRLRDYPKGISYSTLSHSFGTWLNTGMLWRHRAIKPHATILVGSVLSSHYLKTPWPKIFARKQAGKLAVFWSPNDNTIEKLSQPIWGLSPFGHLGSRGFVDGVPENAPLMQVKCDEKHSSYFEPHNRDKYFQQWVGYCLT